MKNNRQIAFEALCKIFKDSSYSTIVLDNMLKSVLSPRDRAFISALVYGVVERKITLDYIIDKFTQSSPKPKVRIILEMGIYQLYYCDKIPSMAAVSESVELAKKNSLGYYSKMINAVLRNADRNRIEISLSDGEDVYYSCPQHLINMLKKAYGEECVESFLPAINGKAPIFAKPNTLYVDENELLYELNCERIDGEIVNNSVKINSHINIAETKAYKNGLFHIQDLSSTECANALNAQQGETVIDFCSAPGGKAFTIAQGMHNKGTVLALDLYEHRLRLIEESAQRLGITCIKTMANDATGINPELPMADKILCDVPCSGFGIIRRKPEIKYKNLDSIKNLPEIQLSILSNASTYLKEGGRIIYSTCTLNKKENENVVNSFLNNNSSFSLIDSKTIFPSVNGGDGFFFAIIERNK